MYVCVIVYVCHVCVCVCVFVCVSVCENSVFLGMGRGQCSGECLLFLMCPCFHIECLFTHRFVCDGTDGMCVCVCVHAHTLVVGVFLGMYMSACCVQIYLCIFKFYYA